MYSERGLSFSGYNDDDGGETFARYVAAASTETSEPKKTGRHIASSDVNRNSLKTAARTANDDDNSAMRLSGSGGVGGSSNGTYGQSSSDHAKTKAGGRLDENYTHERRDAPSQVPLLLLHQRHRN